MTLFEYLRGSFANPDSATWIGAWSNFVVAAAALVAGFRYLTYLSVPISLSFTERFAGTGYIEGKLTTDNFSWRCEIKNEDTNQLLIGALNLERRFVFIWLKVKDGSIPEVHLPTSLKPGGTTKVWLGREKKDEGHHRLIIREYGSLRSRAIPLPEISQPNPS